MYVKLYEKKIITLKLINKKDFGYLKKKENNKQILENVKYSWEVKDFKTWAVAAASVVEYCDSEKNVLPPLSKVLFSRLIEGWML